MLLHRKYDKRVASSKSLMACSALPFEGSRIALDTEKKLRRNQNGLQGNPNSLLEAVALFLRLVDKGQQSIQLLPGGRTAEPTTRDFTDDLARACGLMLVRFMTAGDQQLVAFRKRRSNGVERSADLKSINGEIPVSRGDRILSGIEIVVSRKPHSADASPRIPEASSRNCVSYRAAGSPRIPESACRPARTPS